MDAEVLNALYELQLAEALTPPSAGGVDRRAERRFLDACRRTAPGTLRVRNERSVWVWSDLHLGIAEGIGVFGRPFGGSEELDDALFGGWRRAVDPDDVIVCLGDVPLQGLFGRRLRRLRAAPGRKVLVLGNHDAGVGGAVAADGFDEVYSVLYVPGGPPLLMTHVPLRAVPGGCVNVHGHLHGARVPGATRHVNVSVERVGYRPRPLTAVRRLARRLARRRGGPGGDGALPAVGARRRRRGARGSTP